MSKDNFPVSKFCKITVSNIGLITNLQDHLAKYLNPDPKFQQLVLLNINISKVNKKYIMYDDYLFDYCTET